MRPYLATLAIVVAVCGEEWVQLHGPATAPKGWAPVEGLGDVDPGLTFTVSVGIKRRNVDVLERISAEVSDPRHPKYLNHLTYEEGRDLVDPGADVVREVKEWFKGRVDLTHPHNDFLYGTATAAELQQMLGNATFKPYRHPAVGKTYWRATGPVRVPKRIRELVDYVGGFQGFPLDPGLVHKKSKRRKVEGPAYVGQVIPSVLRSTYNVTQIPTTSGAANLQAIVQLEGEYVSAMDLSGFCMSIGGGKSSCAVSFYVGPNDENHPGLESMTDTEYIMTMGDTATTWVYSYPGSDFCADLLMLSNNVTSTPIFPWVISISYGSQLIDYCTTEMMNRFAQDMTKLTSYGVSFIVASGDDGSGGNTNQGNNNGKLNPSFPASVPSVTAVGSTFFVTGVQGVEEATVEFGSGGGFSYDFDVPSYQASAVSGYLNTVLTPPGVTWGKGRGTPDVSLLGQSYTVLEGGSWYAEYGTSCSAPAFAGMVNQLNEVCLQKSRRPLGLLNPLLYQNPNGFTDITLGSNAIGYNSQAGWYAIKGWDAATGLGTPRFGALVDIVAAACSKANTTTKGYFT